MTRQAITQHEGKKYLRKIFSADGTKTIYVDVYCVLKAFDVYCPATAHAVKKLLCAGLRGKGSLEDDLIGAMAALNRAIDLATEKETANENANDLSTRDDASKHQSTKEVSGVHKPD